MIAKKQRKGEPGEGEGSNAADKIDRLAVLAGVGGIADCGNSQNCVMVCPKDIPLTATLGQAGRDATVYKIKQRFGR